MDDRDEVQAYKVKSIVFEGSVVLTRRSVIVVERYVCCSDWTASRR